MSDKTKYKEDSRFEFEVSGRMALFTDPVSRLGGEKMTFQVPTYEALKGVCKSIYWKPTFIWIVDAVRILSPIQMQSKGMTPLVYHGDATKHKNYTPAYYLYLIDCKYQVRAHIEWNLNNPQFEQDRWYHKHYKSAYRHLAKGPVCDVFLGTRECQADVSLCEFGSGEGFYDDTEFLSFGNLYHSKSYPDEIYPAEQEGQLYVNYWTPVMRNGVIKFCRPEECPVRRKIRPMEKKYFPNWKGMDHENEKAIRGR